MQTDYIGLYDPETLIVVDPVSAPANADFEAFGGELLLTMANEAHLAHDEARVQTDRFGHQFTPQNYVLRVQLGFGLPGFLICVAAGCALALLTCAIPGLHDWLARVLASVLAL